MILDPAQSDLAPHLEIVDAIGARAQRRFGQRAEDPAELGRQRRFLAQRGFDHEAIAWVLRHAGVCDPADS